MQTTSGWLAAMMASRQMAGDEGVDDGKRTTGNDDADAPATMPTSGRTLVTTASSRTTATTASRRTTGERR